MKIGKWDSALAVQGIIPHPLFLEKVNMNAADILKYGHLTVMRSIEGLPETDWETPGVCGVW
jgi:hypothetical protein